MLMCNDVNCKNETHLNAIKSMYNDILSALTKSSEELIDRKPKKYKQIFGWNEMCKELHSTAREAFLTWVENGKPRQGHLADEKRKTQADFKRAVKHCKVLSATNKANKLAENLINNNSKSFWSEVKKQTSNNCTQANTIDNISGDKGISNLWRDYYEDLLNSTISTKYKDEVREFLNYCDVNDFHIYIIDVKDAIKHLKKGKAAGLDKLSAEHFMYASDRIFALLTFCYNAMISHNYMPESITNTILVPIVKDKRGDITEKDNYRPIAITTVASKILEQIFLNKLSDKLKTCDNQFSFK